MNLSVCSNPIGVIFFFTRYSYEFKRQKNEKLSNANLCVSVSVFKSGVNINKIDELFVSTVLIAPVKTKWHENYQKIKPFIMDLSRVEIRTKKSYCSRVKFEIKFKIYCSRGTIAIDGAGYTRTCNHLIRGNQHFLIVLT